MLDLDNRLSRTPCQAGVSETELAERADIARSPHREPSRRADGERGARDLPRPGPATSRTSSGWTGARQRPGA